jgi:hypothetical protein
VGPAQGDEKQLLFSNYSSRKSHLFPLSSRPKRTRISYFALLATTTYAVFFKENRMILINATDLYRKSGEAKWRDLCVDVLSWKCFSIKRSETPRIPPRRPQPREFFLSGSCCIKNLPTENPRVSAM